MKSMVDLLRGHARQRPHHTALTFLADGENIAVRTDYAEIDRKARSIAAQLGQPGERALLLYPSGPDFVTAFLGCLYAGVIAVPAYPPRSDKHLGRLRAIVADAKASLVLTPQDLEFPGTKVIATDRLPDASGEWSEPALPDVALLQYTSGSTGNPKGVVLTHANLLGNLKLLADGIAHGGDPKFVSWLPLFHDMGLIAKLLQAFHWGAECVVMPPSAFLQHPIRWLRAISEHGGTVSGAPNFAFDLCVRRTTPEQREGLDLSSWRVAYNAAEPVRADTVRAFAETFGPHGLRPETMFPCYGLAENSVFVCGPGSGDLPKVSTVDRKALERDEVRPGEHPLVGLGRMSGDQRLRIVSPHSGVALGPNAVGEVWTTGSSTGIGYWQRPEESLATFGNELPGEPGTWLRTGDLGFLDDTGELFLTGRMKDLIIQHGRNLYPQDLERTAEEAHPGLRPGCGAAFTVGDDDEKLVLVQEVVDEAVDAGPAVAAALAADHEVSLHELVLIRTRSVPKTTSGKIARRACRKAYLDGALDVVGRWRPIYDEVLAAVTDRLGRGIAPGQAFASAGVDSVTAVAISGDLQRLMGRPLPATLLFDHPTPEAVARFLSGDEHRPSVAANGADEPVAVIGIGCRFPGAQNPDQFWDLLDRGGDAITERDGVRGGFLDDVAGFDAEFFGIAPSEAVGMDPQQRLLLEVAWEALEHAGIAPTSLAGTRAGVFVGISNNDYARLLGDRLDAHYGTGNALSIAANRLSYVLDLRGPSVAIDTACSSSLVAVHQACASLRSGESRIALAAGVNLILAPHLSTVFTRAKMLAPDGRCKTFSADADGYVRSEGCGVVVLKPLSTALADGDEVLAVIRGSAVNQDGRSNGLTAPNGPAQRAVITDALADAGVTPAEIGYVEAHGTGTPLGDPIEYGALADVLRGNEGCLLGSAKTNIGHLESAAGVAGLIKVVLSLRNGRIPAHRNLGVLNPHIDAIGSPLSIPAANAEWPRRVAGVSSFGFGGTNAHVVVAEAPRSPVERSAHSRYVLALSAHTEAALHELALLYADRLAEGDLHVADVCATANTGRAAQAFRLAVAGTSTAELAAALSDFVLGRSVPPADDLATAWVAGAAVRWPYRGRKVALPTTPFQRRRLWLPDKNDDVVAPQHLWQRVVSPGGVDVFDDHRVQGQVVVPGVGYVQMALTAARELTGARHRAEHVEFHAVLALTGTRTIQVALDDRMRFTVRSGPERTLHASGVLTPEPVIKADPIDPHGRQVDAAEYYRIMARSVEYGPSLRCVDRAWVADGESFASLRPSGQEALLDTGFQLLGLLLDGSSLVLPVGVDRVDVLREPVGQVLAHATAADTSGDVCSGTVRWSDSGGVFAQALGMRLKVVRQTSGSASFASSDIGAQLRDRLALVLEIDPARIDSEQPMTDLGLDSLMSMDLLGDLKRDLGVDVPAVRVLSGASLAELTETVTAQLAELADDSEREEFVL
ncbi:AMP-binding protein [Lentzea tibetensis]|uniref:AMP-binding protein n=1 Tax=Lentzea tibetensis TaxID=2591470 RepID=A0A563EIX9_9PSEU|nr:beta-ketoacyl synthase N-terminal-like domain-containing protein [Lentzea tibetensis]TWP46768.1 AMP-binding protein [Lentzea tibetensis]